MKQKSNKLRKLERERYSILTEDLEHCFICGQSPCDIHEIYCGAKRQVSMRNGFCIPLCRVHHVLIQEYWAGDLALRELCQQVYEETHTREEFIKLIGRNYRG